MHSAENAALLDAQLQYEQDVRMTRARYMADYSV